MPQTRPPRVTPTELRYAILAVQREGNRQLAAALAPLGVTPSQAEVIMVLGEHGPITLKGLGGLLVRETGSPSRLVDSLVKRGLVDRVDNPMDRRQVLIQLTADGRRLRPRVQAAETSIDESLQDAFDEDLRQKLLTASWTLLADTNTGAALSRRFGRS